MPKSNGSLLGCSIKGISEGRGVASYRFFLRGLQQHAREDTNL